MAKLTITQAAKAVGISRTTFYKDIDEKAISFDLNEKGKKVFDPAELARVYPHKFELEKLDPSTGRSQKRPVEQRKTSENVQVEQVLRERVDDLERQVTDFRKDKEDWKQEKKELREIIMQQQKTIEHQQTLLLPAPSEAKEEVSLSKSKKPKSVVKAGESKTPKNQGFFGKLFAWN